VFLSGKENDEAILINAHADTIFSSKTDHTMQVSSDSITGPGVADNSLGLAALVTLPYLLEELEIELNNDLVLLAGVKSLGRGNLEGIIFFLITIRLKLKEPSVWKGFSLAGSVIHQSECFAVKLPAGFPKVTTGRVSVMPVLF
jgi:tripeptide aminopeptidase